MTQRHPDVTAQKNAAASVSLQVSVGIKNTLPRRNGRLRTLNANPIKPSVEFKQMFLTMLEDFDRNGPHNTELYAPAKGDFAKYVQSLLDEEAGINLAEGFVPCTHRWLISKSGELVGVTRLRHNIETPFLSENGGHIGYDVAPFHRRKGYGHLALHFALEEAKKLRLSRVLLYTGQANIASRAVIERAGGKLEQVCFSEFWKGYTCKYWIEISLADENKRIT